MYSGVLMSTAARGGSHTINWDRVCKIAQLGPVLVNDMQPPPYKERAVLIFLSTLLRNVLKRLKNENIKFPIFFLVMSDFVFYSC